MNNKIFKITLFILISVTLCACKSNNEIEKQPENQPVKETITPTYTDDMKIKFGDEKTKLDENSKLAKMFNKLSEYGKEIYDTKEYKNYKLKNDMYFISLNELSSKYDISMFVGEDGTVCDKTNSGIYFKTALEEEIPYFANLIGCSKEELKR